MNDQRNLDIWLRMYEEQIRHARHHEVLRSQSTNMIVVISAALLALYGAKAIPLGEVVGIFIAVVNLYGIFMSLKHYERSMLHAEVSTKYRNVISENTTIGEQALNDVRLDAYGAHRSFLG